MSGLTYSSGSYYDPRLFKKVMGEKNSLFKGHKGADVSDLLLNVISYLTAELENEGNIEDCDEDPDNTNLKESFAYELKMIDKECIINKNFYFFCLKKVLCNSKNNENKHFCNVFQAETFCLFYLETIQKFYGKSIFSLYECFDFYYNIPKSQSVTCSKCKERIKNECTLKFCSTPKILIIILNRGKGKTFKGKVQFDKYLDITDYCEKEIFLDNRVIYRLIGVSTHSGPSADYGHYTAYCYRNDKYYYIIDTHCSIANSFNEVTGGDPYLLFYEKTDIKKEKISLKEIGILKGSNDKEYQKKNKENILKAILESKLMEIFNKRMKDFQVCFYDAKEANPLFWKVVAKCNNKMIYVKIDFGKDFPNKKPIVTFEGDQCTRNNVSDDEAINETLVGNYIDFIINEINKVLKKINFK